MKKIFTLLLFSLSTITFAQTFTLKSKAIGGQATNKEVFNGFGCTGDNVSPQLSWTDAPANTKSFAVTIYDEDAPTGSGFWHWLIFDIPANVTELKSGAGNLSTGIAPKGAIQSLTDFGQKGYGGPCPPVGHGFHKYTITVHALDTDNLGPDSDTNPALVGFNLTGHTLGKASIVMYYKR